MKSNDSKYSNKGNGVISNNISKTSSNTALVIASIEAQFTGTINKSDLQATVTVFNHSPMITLNNQIISSDISYSNNSKLNTKYINSHNLGIRRSK